MKVAYNLLAALWREVALNIGNDENQETQKNRNLDYIIKEKLNAAAKPPAYVQSLPIKLFSHFMPKISS